MLDETLLESRPDDEAVGLPVLKYLIYFQNRADSGLITAFFRKRALHKQHK